MLRQFYWLLVLIGTYVMSESILRIFGVQPAHPIITVIPAVICGISVLFRRLYPGGSWLTISLCGIFFGYFGNEETEIRAVAVILLSLPPVIGIITNDVDEYVWGQKRT